MANRWSDAFKPRALWHPLKEAASDWSRDRAPRLGAALAYYTVFSIVPLLIVIIALIGLFFGEDAAQSAIMGQISSLVGEQSAAAIKDMIQRAEQPSTGLVATVVAVVTLLFGASGVFGQLQDALNTVWGVEPKEGRGVWGFIKDRFPLVRGGRGNGIFAPRVAGAQQRIGRPRKMVQRCPALAGGGPSGTQFHGVLRRDHRPLCINLQGAARCPGSLARCG